MHKLRVTALLLGLSLAAGVVMGGLLWRSPALVEGLPAPARNPGANGDINGDSRRDISDAIALLVYLFQGGPEPVACAAEPDGLESRVAGLEEALGELALRLARVESAGNSDVEPSTIVIAVEEDSVVARGARAEVIASGAAGADDAAVLQAAIDYVAGERAKGALGNSARRRAPARLLILSDLVIRSPIDLADLFGLEISGRGYQNGATRLSTRTPEQIAFDFTNSRFLRVQNLLFDVPRQEGIPPPKCVVFLARDESGSSSGETAFENCDWHGRASEALVYNYGAEVVRFNDCYFNSDGTAVNITNRNSRNIARANGGSLAQGPQSMLQNHFYRSSFIGTGSGPDTNAIVLEGGGNHVVHGCFFGLHNSAYSFRIEQVPGFWTETQGLWIRDTRFECRIVTTGVPRGEHIVITGLTLDGIAVDADDGGPLVDLDRSAGGFDVVVQNFVLTPSRHLVIDEGQEYALALRVLRSSSLWLRDHLRDVRVSVSGRTTGTELVVNDRSAISLAELGAGVRIEVLGRGGTRSSGIARIPAGETSVSVEHGLLRARTRVTATPSQFTLFKVAGHTEKGFVISIPEPLNGVNCDFSWFAEI